MKNQCKLAQGCFITLTAILRGDWDRYRVKYAAERENADVISIGMVVKF